MHKKTDQVHIGDHFCLSLIMQYHLQTAGAEHYTPQCDATNGGTVSVYITHEYSERERRKNTALS